MKKTIRMRMTARRAEAMGFEVTGSLAIRPVEVDLERMSNAARWIAEHITATYVADEYLDQCAIIADSGKSMAQRDRDRGVREEKIQKFSAMHGKWYTEKTVRAEVTFPILSYQEPEAIIEEAVAQWLRAGAVRFICGCESFDIA